MHRDLKYRDISELVEAVKINCLVLYMIYSATVSIMSCSSFNYKFDLH